jgi:hypothetical protein
VAVEHLMIEFRANRLNTRSEQFKKETSAHRTLLEKLTGATSSGDQASADADTDGRPADDSAGGSSRGASSNSGGDTGTAGARPAGASTSGTSGSGGAGQSTGDASGSRGPNHPDTKATLSLSGLDYTTHTSQNLQRRYHELRKVNLKETPVAAALLLRSVLETTIKFHFEGSATPAVGQLSDTVKAVATAYGREKALKHSITMIQSGGTKVPASAQWFNVISHSADLVVEAKQVREAFGLIEPLLRHLLRP